jgi:hypothetical protein
MEIDVKEVAPCASNIKPNVILPKREYDAYVLLSTYKHDSLISRPKNIRVNKGMNEDLS